MMPNVAITCGDKAKRSRHQVHGIVGPFELEIECEMPAHPYSLFRSTRLKTIPKAKVFIRLG